MYSEPILIHYILICDVDPIGNTEVMPSYKGLSMVQQIMSDHDEIFWKIILEYIEKVKEASRNAHFPYINLLTKVKNDP